MGVNVNPFALLRRVNTWIANQVFTGLLDVSGGSTSFGLTKYFESAEQAITAAGALNISHGMGVKPKLLQVVLICKTAEANYAVNDEVFAMDSTNVQLGSTSDRYGISVVGSTTQLNCRYGIATNTFYIFDKNTGNGAGLTNANWRVKIRVWA